MHRLGWCIHDRGLPDHLNRSNHHDAHAGVDLGSRREGHDHCGRGDLVDFDPSGQELEGNRIRNAGDGNSLCLLGDSHRGGFCRRLVRLALGSLGLAAGRWVGVRLGGQAPPPQQASSSSTW